MTVRVKLFAGAREAAGADAVAIELSPGATVADVRLALAESIPALAPLLPSCLVAVNAEYAAAATAVSTADEVALIPPVSGG